MKKNCQNCPVAADTKRSTTRADLMELKNQISIDTLNELIDYAETQNLTYLLKKLKMIKL